MSSQFFCGVDFAKHHFSLHAVNDHGKVILHKSVSRTNLLTKLANIPPMRIGMEACSGAHYWAREFIKFGHYARIVLKEPVPVIDMKGYRSKANHSSLLSTLEFEGTECMQLVKFCFNKGTCSRYSLLYGFEKLYRTFVNREMHIISSVKNC